MPRRFAFLAVSALCLYAQPAFEVASIKPPDPSANGSSTYSKFKLRYTSDDIPPDTAGADANRAKASVGSIFTLLQEKAGLKLEQQKLPVEILVVDQIERQPTEN